MTHEPRPAPRGDVLDEETRRVAVTAVAASAIGWWPAFTLGVYGVVFFEQQLALWATATTVFLTAVVTVRRRLWHHPAVWSLLLPSLWLALAWALPPGGTALPNRLLFWFGIAVTVLGIPVMAALLVRLLVPGAGRISGRSAAVALGVVLLVMLVSYGLGTQNTRILTCDDFTVSGNFAPPGCSPGEVGSGLGRP